MQKKIVLLIVFVLLLMLSFCDSKNRKRTMQSFLRKEPFPSLDSAKLALGEALFFDKTLSKGNEISCASCHLPEKSFADGKGLSRGVRSQKGSRNAPALINLFREKSFFLDGRASSLEEQALGPLFHPKEMANGAELIPKLNKNENYLRQFTLIYGDSIRLAYIVDALVEFEKSLIFNQSPFDRFLAGDSTALDSNQIAGFEIFKGKGNCVDCHQNWNLNDDRFHNIAFLDTRDPNSDKGRFVVTKQKRNLGQFKTPSLRNIALTAPYFHKGQSKTLKDLINLYNKPMPMGFGMFKDSLIKAIHLTEQEKYQLHQFLMSLTDKKPLLKYVDEARLDSIIANQAYSEEEFERTYYLPIFNQRIRYFKKHFPHHFAKIVLEKELKNASESKAIKLKIDFTKRYLDGNYKSIFEDGKFLLE